MHGLAAAAAEPLEGRAEEQALELLADLLLEAVAKRDTGQPAERFASIDEVPKR